MLRTRIGARVILGVVLVMTLTLGLMTLAIVPAHRTELIDQLTHNADRLSEAIKNSARDSMLENRRDHLRRQIEAVGRQEGIDRVRIFNKDGMIMLSSDADEIGRVVDTRGEACYACHSENRPLEHLPIPARSRIFPGPDGGRVLGIINPIQNEPGCYTASCHAHSPRETVLGVLDVTMPLAEVDAQISRSQVRMAGLAGLALVTSGLLLWWLNRRLVVRPVAALAAGTRRVAEGDLTTTIPVTATHELGDLARAFNDMTHRLSEAQRQITQADKLASLGRLAAGVAHEINNPLTGVLTYSSFLQKSLADQPEIREDLDVIVRETKRCREIVRGLLDFARQTPPKRQPVDINEVVRHAVGVVMNELALNRVALALDLSEDIPRISADGNQMEQVVVNLVLNAADAIGESGGSIRLSSRQTSLPPRGHAPIRRAACPRGCDLLDRETRIGGLPSIRVIRSAAGRKSVLHLDPVYGRFNHLSVEPMEEGVTEGIACPGCRTSLLSATGSCGRCGSPVFAVQVAGAGSVEWCMRGGCHEAKWKEREALGDLSVVEFVVEDTGRGISQEEMRHLFEPFFSTKGAGGTGLGLAVTWGIVEGHGGTIDVESEIGKGSRFTVRLPLRPEEFEEPVAA